MKVGRDRLAEDGRVLDEVNPKGYLPALQLDNGSVLTEGLVLLTYIAEKSGRLLPKEGMERWRALEATEFMTSELHGNFKPLFHADSPEPQKEKARTTLARRFATLADQLGDKPFLIGEQMTIADPLLFVMLSWAAFKEVEVPEPLNAYRERMKTRPSVMKTLAAEGLA